MPIKYILSDEQIYLLLSVHTSVYKYLLIYYTECISRTKNELSASCVKDNHIITTGRATSAGQKNSQVV